MRKTFDFHGGIHPAENKRQSLGEPIVDAGIPPVLTLPLSQHIGAPATPVVSVGERVLKGQQVAEASGFVSVPIHAPTSGKVTAIEPRTIAHPSGHSAPCIVIETDGLDEWGERSPISDYRELDSSALLEKIRQAGIAGMGGAGFPAAVKLAPRGNARIETLIINGTECEPYITADDALMRERSALVIEGVKILQHILQPGETLIGVEDNKPEGVAALRAAIDEADIEVVTFPTKYPSGGEKQLIEILTGKQVPSGGLPADVGIVCQNLGSTAAIAQAIVEGRPLISRITTVTGEAVGQPQNFDVLLGTPMAYLLDKVRYQAAANSRLIMGGPMMGFSVPRPDVPIVKTTNCLLAPTEAELPTPPPAQACIRCGMCAEACPASLLPQQMFWFAQGKEHEKLEQHNLFDCIECGACSWVCPSAIPLVQYYRASKAEIVQARKDHEKSEYARGRFEARQQRLEQEEIAREAKRAARKKAAEERARNAAQSSEGSEDPIQAAIERAKAKKAAQASSSEAQDPREKLEAAVLSARKRLDTASSKLAEAEQSKPELVDALRTGVEKTRAKLAAAEEALTQFQQQSASSSTPQAQPGDAAQAAIARAKAARAAAAELSPVDKARQDLEKLQQRLTKSELKLAESREGGQEDKVIEALEATIVRLQQKISAAQDTLVSLENN